MKLCQVLLPQNDSIREVWILWCTQIKLNIH